MSLKYTEEHEWILVNGDVATVGITHHAQDALGDVVFVELPEVGSSFEQKAVAGWPIPTLWVLVGSSRSSCLMHRKWMLCSTKLLTQRLQRLIEICLKFFAF